MRRAPSARSAKPTPPRSVKSKTEGGQKALQNIGGSQSTGPQAAGQNWEGRHGRREYARPALT